MTKSVVNVHEAKTHLSRLLERVEAGEEIDVARRGTVIATLVPAVPPTPRLGTMPNIAIGEDFNAPLHAASVGELPLHHRDPFDRSLVAQAQMLGVPLVTADPAMGAYDVDVIGP